MQSTFDNLSGFGHICQYSWCLLCSGNRVRVPLGPGSTRGLKNRRSNFVGECFFQQIALIRQYMHRRSAASIASQIICQNFYFVCDSIDALPLTSVSRSCSPVKIRVSASHASCRSWSINLEYFAVLLLTSQRVLANICRQESANLLQS